MIWRILPYAVLVLGFALAALAIYSSPTFQQCAGESATIPHCSAAVLNANTGTVNAVLTGFVAIATFMLWLATRNLWKSTDQQEKASRIHERAYIYGGVGSNTQLSTETIQVQITMANYGRTPGFVLRIEVVVCHQDDLPDEPDFTGAQVFHINDLYFPDMKMVDRRKTRAIVLIPADGAHVVYQRVHFKDVFKQCHYSGSAYRMFVADNKIRDEPIHDPKKEKYWEWK